MDQPGNLLKPNILIAPLDWGLGHATRCIPIIRQLLSGNCNVLIAAEGKVETLLQTEFPQLTFVPLKGYRIEYSKNRWTLPLMIGKQIPKILAAIQHEQEELKTIVKTHAIDGIISDNRYGFYHEHIPSVFITHQLLIKTPFGNIGNNVLQQLNYKFISRFSECWVPDRADEPSLAGDLAHPNKQPSVPVKYIGPLSRFQQMNSPEKDLLILLSGPEPQRTLFEHLITAQLKEYKAPVVLVRGLPEETGSLHVLQNISVYNHLPSETLNQKMSEASMVISRCGYSTVMDLAGLQKKSILIPTPGQTEQEYLATHLMKNNFALCIDQKKFRLNNALNLASQFNYQLKGFSSGTYLDDVVEEFTARIKSRMK
jgi:uncharacterized protein (TIGR00661 family)